MTSRNPWYVITGAPCCGKTSVVQNLAQRGYRVVHETARAVIDEHLRQGLTMSAIKSAPAPFENEILRRKQNIEKTVPDDQIVFFDRGIPDSIAYFVAAGLDPEPVRRISRGCRYRGIFFLEPLEIYHTDRQRKEEPEEMHRLHRLLEQSYAVLDFPLFHIPKAPIRDRADRILQHVFRIERSNGEQQFT